MKTTDYLTDQSDLTSLCVALDSLMKGKYVINSKDPIWLASFPGTASSRNICNGIEYNMTLRTA